MHPEVIGGRYRVGAAIGQGGMGTVWLCRDELLERDVAIKQVGLLPGESVTDSARALREARSSAALSHRNVVTVFDVVVENDAVWLVMEHVPSRSLSQILKEEGALDPVRVADIGAQVADGLAAAHAGGTTHRDVKPGNVLVRDDGVAKISDFGIARSLGDPTLTQSGMVTGTPAYFAPELARGETPGPASDVWALGATLYAAVEGRPPYRPQPNPVAVLHEIASQQPAAPRRAGSLEPVLARMMDRNPSSRWSMADAAHALHRLAQEHAPEQTRADTLAPRERSGQPAAPSPIPRDTGRRGRRGPRSALAALVAVALLAVAAGIGYAVFSGRDPGSQNGATSSAGGGSPSRHRSSSPGPSASPSGSATASTSAGQTRAPSSPASTAASSAPPGSGGLAAEVAFLQGYFGEVPGGTDQAWNELTPAYQRQIGRSSFVGFWKTIDSVEVGHVVPAGHGAVDATLTYHTTDGRTSTERHRIDLVRSGDGYRIGGDRSV